MDRPHAKKRTFDHSPLAEPIDRSISTDCTTKKKKTKKAKKTYPLDERSIIKPDGLRLQPTEVQQVRGGSKGFTQPPSASNPLPPSASDQARTNHEGPVISCR
ncbi:hypothetical protein PGT21_033276 [Puccinia graminis f. sp. tritici]|uniref:Uncharacterized protein n=1 Tax=Puccinia graminis f. sp. tritici TaxID=56615 RepID=A0A5B0PAG9_PUCGR|nr:hypothetical protein PGT21_033276 [Puccinia graminis f. sp. tritici]